MINYSATKTALPALARVRWQILQFLYYLEVLAIQHKHCIPGLGQGHEDMNIRQFAI